MDSSQILQALPVQAQLHQLMARLYPAFSFEAFYQHSSIPSLFVFSVERAGGEVSSPPICSGHKTHHQGYHLLAGVGSLTPILHS